MVSQYITRIYSSFAAHVFDIPPRLLAFLLLLILAVIPIGGMDQFTLAILTSANVVAMFAASWDLLVGRAGQISLGHALFFGGGAYVTAFLFERYGLPLWITIPLSILITTLFALLVAFPCLRVKGPYLALVTMAFPIIAANIVKWSPLNDIFHGELGFRGLPRFFPSLKIQDQALAEYYLTLLLLFISSVILYKVANSKTGIVLVSILDDEVASKASGINVTRYKLMAFAISGLFASLAGCTQAHILKLANPPMLDLSWSFIPVVLTFLGGIGTIYGPLLGAYIYYILDRYVLTTLVEIPPDLVYTKLLIFTAIVVILILKWPRGIARFATDKLQDLQEARDIDERGPRIWKKYKKKK